MRLLVWKQQFIIYSKAVQLVNPFQATCGPWTSHLTPPIPAVARAAGGSGLPFFLPASAFSPAPGTRAVQRKGGQGGVCAAHALHAARDSRVGLPGLHMVKWGVGNMYTMVGGVPRMLDSPDLQ